MKYKDNRRAELKKAVARYVTRSTENNGSVAELNPSQAVVGVQDDEQYLSDYNDDLV